MCSACRGISSWDLAGGRRLRTFHKFPECLRACGSGGLFYVGEVEVDHGLAVDAEAEFVDDFMMHGWLRRGDEVAVLGIPVFEESTSVQTRDGLAGALVSGGLGNPDAGRLAAG